MSPTGEYIEQTLYSLCIYVVELQTKKKAGILSLSDNNSIEQTFLRFCMLIAAYVQLVKKFSAFYGNLRFITVFTRARHLSLS
jgi:hypothetical protein